MKMKTNMRKNIFSLKEEKKGCWGY